jgi:hypothetical protein
VSQRGSCTAEENPKGRVPPLAKPLVEKASLPTVLPMAYILLSGGNKPGEQRTYCQIITEKSSVTPSFFKKNIESVLIISKVFLAHLTVLIER